MAPNRDSSTETGRPSKVRQLIEEYDLDHLAAELERRWTAPDEERESLRDLASYANQQALQHVMTEAGLTSLAGEIENTYRLLTSEEVSDADRTQAERRLERAGIDVDELRERFVSYQAVRTFLQSYRGVDYPGEEQDNPVVDPETVQRMVGRTESIARAELERMQGNDRITLGEFTVSAPVRVFCTDCGSRFEFTEFLAQRSCDCE